jgi:branched-chain amino acid transport system substrate-binding protein
MKKIFAIWLTIVLVVTLSIVACAPAAQEVSSKTLKWGVCLPLTGPNAGYGVPTLAAIQVEVAKINSEGGVKIGGVNYQIEVIAEDDGFTSDGAKTAGEKLVFRDKVKFIWGGTESNDTLGLQLVTVPNKVMTFNTAWADTVLRDPATKQAIPYSFKVLQAPHETLRGVWGSIQKAYPEIHRVALFTPNTLSGHYGQELSAKLVPYLGYEVVYNDYFEFGTPDFTSYLSKILATNPDIIHGSATGLADWGSIIKQSREMGYQGYFMYELALGGDLLFSVATKEAAEGFIGLDFPWHGPNTVPELKDFSDKYVAAAGFWFPELCNLPIAAECLVQAMQTAGSIDDTDKITQILETSTFNVMGQSVQFAGKEYYGANRVLAVPLTVAVIKGGELVPIGAISVAEQVSPWPPGLD